MSIKVSRAVWEHFREGGNLKLTMLALADWSDDDGGRIYPSMASIAVKVCCSQAQARRTVHALIARGVVEVVGNESGGPPGSTRRYRINLQRLTAGVDARPTPCVNATPTAGTHASGKAHRPLAPMQVDALHRCSFTPCTGASLTVIEPSVNREVLTLADQPTTKQRRQRRRLPVTACPNELAVTDAMSEWAIEQGVPADRVMPETAKFLNRNAGNGTMQADWIATWRNWMLKSVEFSQRSPRMQSTASASQRL
jgi:hypothetical protein